MSHQTLLHRAIRPGVRHLARTRVQPNHLSILRLLTALAAAGCFAHGSLRALWIGSALFACSAMLDRADGEFARQTGRFTRLGHRLDLVGDCLADALAFLALGVGARNGALGPFAPVLGSLAGASVVALFLQLNSRGRSEPVIRLVDPDDAILLVPVLLLCFGATPVVTLAGIITPVAAVYARLRRLTL